MKEHNQRTRVMEVTPDWAARKLAEHERMVEEGLIRQRPVPAGLVAKYAGDMKRKRWALSHQGIAFDEESKLIDGLKRLWAVVKAGVPVRMAVTTGVPAKTDGSYSIPTMDIVDMGQQRSIAHQLRISHGIAGASKIASAIRNIVHVHTSDFELRLPITAYLEIYDAYQHDIESVGKFATHLRQRVGPVIAPLAIYHANHPEKARAFAASYFSKENLGKGSPVLALIKWRELNPAISGKSELAKTLRTICHAIHEFHHDKELDIAQPVKEAMYWLGSLNKANAEKVRKIAYPLREK